ERADTYQNQHYNPCVIYCHGNAGCRTESHNLIPVLIPRGIALVVFDFTGCGRSEGDYITLGWREQSDLENVITYVTNMLHFEKIVLWGRSMGAVAALLCGAKTLPWVRGIIMDSPFASMNEVVQNFTQQADIPCGCCLFPVGRTFVRRNVIKKTGLDIDSFNPIDVAGQSHLPVMIAHAKQDTTINCAQSKEIFDVYGSADKHLVILPGGHNDKRPLIVK
ncbi:MAG: hypothetical protein EZS28_027677, partial [Streblomastix strix]